MSGQNGRDDAARLEAALDRIAGAANRLAQSGLPDPPAEVTTTHAQIPELAARLDNVIAHLRAALGTEV